MFSEIWTVATSPWVPAVALLFQAASARLLRKSWLSPCAFVALIWAIYVIGCLILTDYQIFSEGIWLIVLFVFCIQFGTVLAQGFTETSVHPVEGPDDSTLRMWSDRSFTFTILFTIITLAGTVHLLLYSLEKYSLGFSFAELLSLGHLWSVARYSKGELEPWSVRLSIMWVYPAALLAGVCFATAKRRVRKYASIAPLIPAALIGTLFAARAGLLISGVCWLGGFLAIRYYRSRGTYALFQRKLALSMLTLALCGMLFFVAIDTLRIFEGGDNVELRIDAPRISKYFFGAVPAFSDWVHYDHTTSQTMGAFTFSGVFDLLGLKPRQIGVYGEVQTLAGGEETNIYTLFRGLIQDFTVPGACLFCGALGFLAGTAALFKPTSRPSGTALTLAGYYALIIFSPIISLFVYNGLILAWGVTAVVLAWNPHPKTLESRRPVPA